MEVQSMQSSLYEYPVSTITHSITSRFWYGINTCEERLMRVVTTRTMTITVSSTLDKPTKGRTLRKKVVINHLNQQTNRPSNKLL